MGFGKDRPQTLVETVLNLLEERFPWLTAGQDRSVSGAETIDELSDLYRALLQEREEMSREHVDLPDKTRND